MKSVITVVLALICSVSSYGQTDDQGAEYREFWLKIETEYKNPDESPLSKGEMADFDSVPRYEYNPEYRVEAVWEERKYEKPFKIESTGPRKSTYQRVAILHFKIGNDSLQLSAYQNLELMRNPVYKDYIFLPFTDESNGFETYGGGRYIDFTMPTDPSAKVILDFNKAYNPYCAYSDAYSCPIPPRENNLKVKVPAGAKYEYK